MPVTCDMSFTTIAVFYFRPHSEMRGREADVPGVRTNLQSLPYRFPKAGHCFLDLNIWPLCL